MVSVGLSLLVSLPIIGCGGGSGTTTATLTQTQALTATSDIFDALAVATGSAGYMRPGVGKAEAMGIRNTLLGNSPIASIAAPRIAPVNPLTTVTLSPYTYDCPSGGTIVVSGSISGTPTSSSFSVVEAIKSCMDGGLTINGDPNVTVTGSATQSGNLFSDTVTMSGGFSAGGNTCLIDVTVTATVNDMTYAETGSVSGSVCGIDVSGTL
jgi:hypothetical protein